MISIIVVILTVIANLLVAVVVIKKNPNSITNVLVASLSIITALWTIFNFLALQPSSEEIHLFWVRTVMFVTSSYGTVILLLASAFPETKLSLSKKSVVVILLVNMLSYAFAYSPFMFTQVTNNPDGSFNLFPGWAIIIYAVGFMGFMALGFYRLIKKLNESSGILRIQLRLLLTGLIISFSLLTLTNFIAVVVFHSIQLTYLGPPCTLILFGFVMYAIIKHKFLDITAVIARAVSYTILLAVVVFIEVAVLWFVSRFFPINVDRTIVAFCGSIVIVLGYGTIKTLITNLTDKIFFQGRYDAEKVLKRLTTVMVREMDIKTLTKKLLRILKSEINISDAEVILIQEKQKLPHYKELYEVYNKTIVRDYLAEGNIKELFRNNNLSVAIPLVVKHESIGLLLLGEKSSGDIYTDGDIRLLEIFAPQAAIAIKNAQSYKEIQEFNKTLGKRVAERTKELEKSQAMELKLKDEFVFIATHDLSAPVVAISGFVSMINSLNEKLSPELKSDLEAIEESSMRLKSLVKDLLQVARSDSGTIKVDLMDMDAESVIKAAVRQNTPAANERKIKIILDLDNDNHVMADPMKLAEVLENLMSNGIKYNKENGSLTVSSRVSDDRYVLEIKDTGFGIAQEEQSKVFSKFFRSEEPEIRQRPGTGLGLFVVRMLVEKMGGKIGFKSKEGEGTIFTLSFKRK